MIILGNQQKNETYYCFPDIHGQANLLKQALDFVYKKHPDGGKIIFLGDYIDRGYDNKTVLETVMYPPKDWEFICLKGNHEDMFVNSYLNKTEFFDMKVLLDHYSGPGLAYYETLHDKFPREIVEWMMNLKLFHFEGNNVFAHAFYDTELLPEQQNPDMVMWQRFDDFIAFRSPMNNLYLTHGHTPRKNGPIRTTNRVNLDCGACFYQRYVIGEYKQGVTGPVTFHEFKE